MQIVHQILQIKEVFLAIAFVLKVLLYRGQLLNRDQSPFHQLRPNTTRWPMHSRRLFGFGSFLVSYNSQFLVFSLFYLIIRLLVHSVERSSPCNWKKTENWTGLDHLGPDWQLWLHAFQTAQPDRFGLVSHVIPLKNAHIWAYFEEKWPRNGWDAAKTICYSKIQLCSTSHTCIFWVLDNFLSS